MSRYFIVFYRGNVHKGSITGQTTYKTFEGRYIRKDWATDDIQKRNNATDVVITNIIELTEDDYYTFESLTTPSPAG